MIRNAGERDRVARVFAGIPLPAVVLVAALPWRRPGLPDLVPLATDLVRAGPACALPGLSTCPDQGVGRGR